MWKLVYPTFTSTEHRSSHIYLPDTHSLHQLHLRKEQETKSRQEMATEEFDTSEQIRGEEKEGRDLSTMRLAGSRVWTQTRSKALLRIRFEFDCLRTISLVYKIHDFSVISLKISISF